VSQSPCFSAPLIGLRSLGFVRALWARRTLVPVPRLAPLLLWCCARGGPLPYTAGAPDQGADQIGFPIRRSGDHIPNKIYPSKFPIDPRGGGSPKLLAEGEFRGSAGKKEHAEGS
jgi:hypothetical protein